MLKIAQSLLHCLPVAVVESRFHIDRRFERGLGVADTVAGSRLVLDAVDS